MSDVSVCTEVELLEQLVAIRSETGNELAILIFCENYLQALGFETQRQHVNPDLKPERFNLLATRGQADSYLMLYSHVDTVHAEPAWQQNPFELTVNGDQLIGLGTSDMKAGLALILTAAKDSSAPLKIALGVDEEAWSQGAWELIKSPWCQNIQAILVPELSIDSDNETLGIGRRGHLGFEITVSGPRQHGAVPLESPPAIEQACRLVQNLRLACHPQEALIVRQIASLSQDLTYPETCRLTISYLTLPGKLLHDYAQGILRAGKGMQLDISPIERPSPAPEAYAIDVDHPLIKWLQEIAQQQQLNLPCTLGWSAADENVLATLGVPVLSLAPVGGKSHCADEWISQRSLKRLRLIYRDLIERFGMYHSEQEKK